MIGHRSVDRSAIKLVYFGSGTMVRVLRSGDGRSGRCYLRLFNAVVKLLEPLEVITKTQLLHTSKYIIIDTTHTNHLFRPFHHPKHSVNQPSLSSDNREL